MLAKQQSTNSPFAYLKGAGLGLRRSIFRNYQNATLDQVDFLEFAPENWVDLGGVWRTRLEELTDKFPAVAHGLSLSLGSPEPLDLDLLERIKYFLNTYNINGYSEHLCYTSGNSQLYELFPLPMHKATVNFMADRIKFVQDYLQKQIAVEHISFYADPVTPSYREIDFVCEVLTEADCYLLLDVNNVWCNSQNHKFDPYEYINSIPTEKIAYIHIAGHFQRPDGLIIDTHGAEVIDSVWKLLQHSYKVHGISPTLLERDFNFPPFLELMEEVDKIRSLQEQQSSNYAN